MIQYAQLSPSQLPCREVNKTQFVGRVTDLIGSSLDGSKKGPQAFLVEQSANWSLPTHFHEEHQFQVFVNGSGALGNRPISPFEVHYASPHTGYGPLVAGKGGVSYLTLRAMSDTGAWYLPESRARNLRVPKMNAHASPETPIEALDLSLLIESTIESLIRPHGNGLAAWMMKIKRGQPVLLPTGSEHGGGRFLVVCKGSLIMGQHVIGCPGVIWLDPQDEVQADAGSEGVALIVLQFPSEALQSFRLEHFPSPT